MPKGQNPIRSEQCTGLEMPSEWNPEGFEKCARPRMPKNPSPKGLEIKRNEPRKICMGLTKGGQENPSFKG